MSAAPDDRPDAPRRLEFTVSGRVQGVHFRVFTQANATALGLTGQVRNLPDGRVQGHAEGPTHALLVLLAALREGPARAQVDAVDSSLGPALGADLTFAIRR